MTANWRLLLIICLGTLGWALSFGIGSQATTLTLNSAGCSDFLIGLNTAAYYLGIALGSLLVPGMLHRNGCRSAAWGMLASGAALALFPWGPGVWGWLALRLLAGVAGAFSIVPLETFISSTASPANRSRRFAWFAVALTTGGALGIGLGPPLYEILPHLTFYLGAIPTLFSGLLLWWLLPAAPLAEEEGSTTSLDWRGNFLSYGSAWAQGFLEGGMLAFLALYLLALGLDHERAGTLMGATLFGVILFQVPVGWLADRLGTTTVLLACYAVTVIGLISAPWCSPGWALTLWLFLIGACSGAFYPLGLALLSARLPVSALPRAYACYMALECLGSMLGPLCMGRARDLWGEPALFGVGITAVLLVPALWVMVKPEPRS